LSFLFILSITFTIFMLHWDDMNISGDDVAVSALGLSNLWGSFVVVSIYFVIVRS